MKSNNYNIEKIIDSLYNKGYTNFLNPKDLSLVKGKLSKNEYKVYELYPESNKVILYKKDMPDIKLYKITSKVSLRHQDILGTIFSLGLKEDTFGDIIKYEDSFYIFLLFCVFHCKACTVSCDFHTVFLTWFRIKVTKWFRHFSTD